MDETTLDGIESLRVMRAGGNLTITGIDASPLRIISDQEPDLRRNGAAAEVYFTGNAELAIPPGVAVEVVECAGHLEVEEFSGNLSLNHVAGHFNASAVGPIVIRGNIDGRFCAEDAGAIAGKCVKGDLLVERARSVSFDLVAGNVACGEIAGEVAIEQVGGRCSLEEIGGDFRSLTVGGKLEVERVHSLKIDTVGGKLRALRVAGDVTVATVGGKVTIDGAGSVAIATVGGQVSVRAITGNVDIAQVGGAARLGGDFAAASNWRVRTGGRMLVELRNASSVEIEANARHGRVRVYGIEGELRFAGRDRLSAKFGAGECKLALESRGADIIIEGEDSRASAGVGAGFRWRDIGAPFENLGDEIPAMVADIVGAAGRIVAETGSFSGGLVRGVTRGVGEAMREVEREIGEIKQEVPEQAAERLSKLGRRIHGLVDEALKERRGRSRADAERIRARIREEAARMRDAVREARQRARARAESRSESPEPSAETQQVAPGASSPAPDPDATRRLEPDKEILRILAAVRAGEIDPEEADDLIRALMEVERADPGAKPAA